jgi:predicted transcriptional regulator
LIRKPVAIGSTNAAELNAELEKGYADVAAGRFHDPDDIVAGMQRDST